MNPNPINYDNFFNRTHVDVLNMKWDLGSHSARKAVRGFITAKGGRLLEIGIGYGHFLEELPSAFTELHAVDISSATIEFARQNIKRPVHWHIGSLESLSIEANFFDVITSSHVIEHIENDLSFLRECMRLLKHGGEIVMLAPGNLSGIAPKEQVEFAGHFRNYNRQTVEKMVADLPDARLERIVFIHQILGRVWPRINWLIHAIHYPFKRFILRDDCSVFERRLYHWSLPFIENLLDWIDCVVRNREGMVEPYNVMFRIRKLPKVY